MKVTKTLYRQVTSQLPRPQRDTMEMGPSENLEIGVAADLLVEGVLCTRVGARAAITSENALC